jgi:V/A-type H+-transporting ATPase subunit I
MSLRPARARWFELLTTREHLALAIEALAATGSVELETRGSTHSAFSLQNLQEKMEEYNRLARRYQPYWPHNLRRPARVPGKPVVVLDAALLKLREWEAAARPLILSLEALANEQTELQLLESMLAHARGETLDFALLARPGGTVAARLFALPGRSRIEHLPGSLLTSWISSNAHDFLLAVGLTADLDALGAELAAVKARTVEIPPGLQGTRRTALQQVRRRSAAITSRLQLLRLQIEALAAPHQLTEALGDVYRLDWLITNVSSLPVSENFAWVTGWTSDLSDRRLSAALQAAGVDALLHFPSPPGGVDTPMVMQNPWWAQPFELFARMLGTPSRDEADPSRLLAVLAPLLFGYMFGDVGQGLILLLAGLLLQRRWPVVRILIANGLSAMFFGLVFGSVFGREDILPALWLHPIEDPLPVLLVPLAGGVLILLLGLLLNAVESYWRGEMRQWLQVEAAVLVLYLSLIAGFFLPGAVPVAGFALIWYFCGNLLQARARFGPTLLAAAGTLLENILQLLINTVSFVRVGAFALAHGGLSLAFIIMADATASPVVAFLVLLLGNLVVIMLEGLVVTIQTTRLILFEFFIRFLRGSGRMFRPLAAPAATVGIRRVT